MHTHGNVLRQDILEAEKWFRKAALQQHPDAQFHLALMYLYGEGLPKDLKTAIKWLSKAVKNGNIDARKYASTLIKPSLEKHIKIEDHEKFIAIYEKARYGDSAAQYTLAVKYLTPPCSEKSYIRSYLWAKLAQFYGHESADNLISVVSNKIPPLRMRELESIFKSWTRKTGETSKQLIQDSVEVKLSEIDSNTDLLSYSDRHIVLFIPDQDSKVESVKLQPELGHRFHISNCRTLKSMQNNKMMYRYNVTSGQTGYFKASDSSGNKLAVKLLVCKNCLRKIEYKSSYELSSTRIDRVVRKFSLENFFREKSHLFKEKLLLPQQLLIRTK